MAGVSLNTILFAAIGGIIPTFFWLWFWLTKESDHDARPGLVVLAYIGGMLGVLLLLPLRPFVEGLNLQPDQITLLYAFLEELIKFGLIALMTFGHSSINDGSDYTIYLVTGALGFSALENTLYLINPIMQNTDLQSLLVTGNLRFFGATVLHSISVALVGVILGLAFSAGSFVRLIHIIVGLVLATGLHTAFNYFIMQDTRQGTIIAIAGIWFVAVIVILLFDRLKALQANITNPDNPLA
jgi:RsiW-degrading membrane proteinase PrsW (M82 family)